MDYFTKPKVHFENFLFVVRNKLKFQSNSSQSILQLFIQRFYLTTDWTHVAMTQLKTQPPYL